MERLPLPSDPEWDTGAKRTAIYLKFRKDHAITDLQVMTLTGKGIASIWHWRTGNKFPIGTTTLRCFIYDYLLTVKK